MYPLITSPPPPTPIPSLSAIESINHAVVDDCDVVDSPRLTLTHMYPLLTSPPTPSLSAIESINHAVEGDWDCGHAPDCVLNYNTWAEEGGFPGTIYTQTGRSFYKYTISD